MKYCNLRDIHASSIVMGCMRIADKPLAQTEKVMVEAMRTGVNMFDLADVYGGGDCEKVFGVAIRDLGVPRKDYILQTKCGIRKDNVGKIARYDFSKDYILSSVEGSLKRLNMEYIDVLLLHRPDTLVDPYEVAEAFERLSEDGKVRAFGVSNFSAQQIALFRSSGIEVVANQMQFSLGHTLPVDAGFNVNMSKDESVTRAGDALEYCRAKKIPLQAWSPLQYGFFEGTFIGNEKFPKLNAVLSEMAEKYECTPTAIAFAWILRHPAFGQVVTGTTTPERMRDICKAGEINLSHKDWYELYMATGKTLP
ncbi:MAG: aldo/keto reductase family oxidoreductase [Clostridiales bacterium]|nr:aldo/keto reductase family oxidoreductase [Clostridiales bacterium]